MSIVLYPAIDTVLAPSPRNNAWNAREVVDTSVIIYHCVCNAR